MMNAIAENALVAKLTASVPRHPGQMNAPHESDAEILRLVGDPRRFLAVTTDSIVEEIDQQIYIDPYHIGWMTVMANLSDLAAVGASPLGLLLSETLPHDASVEFVKNLQEGIGDACRAEETSILGGDTNRSDRLHMSATAIGLIDAGKPTTRIGCRVGDILYCTGTLGSGNAFAAQRVLESGSIDTFLPVARVREGIALCPLGSACMDTSDGLFATLDQLGRLNNIGFRLDDTWEEQLDATARAKAEAIGLHPWMLFAGPHGEYELVLSVRPEHQEEVEALPFMDEGGIHRIGQIVETPGIALGTWGTFSSSYLAKIRNYNISGPAGAREFIRFLFSLEARCRKSTQA